MPRGRKPKYPAGLTIRQFLLLDQARRRGKAISQEALQKALDSPFALPTELRAAQIREIGVEELDLPSRATGPMKALKIRTVEDLMGARRLDLLAQRRFGEISLTRIRRELLDLLFPSYVGYGEAGRSRSFSAMVKCFVDRTISNERKAALTLGRLAPDTERPEPLREFGQRYGLSRERIRQIVDSAYRRLQKPAVLTLLNPFWQELCAVLESWERPIPIARLGNALTRRRNWQATPPTAALGRLLALNRGLLLQDGMVSLRRDAAGVERPSR